MKINQHYNDLLKKIQIFKIILSFIESKTLIMMII